MALQHVLLLLGIIVVVLVALTSIDRARISRYLQREKRGEDSPGTASLSSPEQRHIEYPNDMPVSPLSADRRFIKIDPAVKPARKSAEDSFREELEDLEEIASIPLDFSTGAEPVDATTVGTVTAVPDEKIDFLINFPGTEPVRRDTALAVFRQHEYKLEKSRHLYGRRYKTEIWSDLERDAAYTEYGDLALAIQKVDTRGPIDESELNTFIQMGLDLADRLHRHPKLPLTVEQGVEQAKHLQEFCDAYDVIAAANVVSEHRSFKGHDIERAARRVGMEFGPMKIFHRKNEHLLGCRHLFSMANMYEPGEFDPNASGTFETRGLTMFMNVPCSHQPAAVFEEMVQAAKELARQLNGTLLDQDRKPLTDKGIALIRGQIDSIADAMRRHGIVAGSAAAVRLFSHEMR